MQTITIGGINMGQTVEEKILSIKVRYDDAIRGIAEYQTKLDGLRETEKKLKENLKAGKTSREEYNIELAKTKVDTDKYKYGIQVLSKEMQNNIRAENEQQGSLIALRSSLSNLTRQYDKMSEAERNSSSGQDLEIHINAITDKIKDAEEKTQRFYRNVGNYQEAFEKALSPLKKQLEDTTDAYLQMSEEERNGAVGQEMRDHLNEIREELRTTSEAGGQFQNQLLSLVGIQNGFLGNVSNYTAGMSSMSQAFMAGKAAVSAFAKQLLALLANPIVMVLAGIALVVMTVAKAINSSEEASNRWSVVMAPLTRALNFFLKGIQELAGGILYIVEVGAKLTNWLAGLAERIPVIGKYIKEMNDANREAVALEKEKIAIEVQSRENEVQNAKDALTVSELRTKAKDKEKYTAQERLAFVKEANKLEEEQAKRNEDIAKRKFETLKLESSWAENNTETNRELAAAEAEMYRARKEYFDKTRELKEQENTIINEEKTAEKAALDAKKQAADKAKAIRDKEIAEVRKAEDELLKLVKDERSRQTQELNYQYVRQIEDLQRRLKTETDLTKSAKEAISKQIVALEQQKTNALQKLSDEQLAKEISNRQKIIETMLSSVKSGSEQEYQLKMQQLVAQRDAELQQKELTEQMKLAIAAKYNKLIDDLTDQQNNNIIKKQEEALKLRFETEIAQAHGNEEEILRIKMEQKLAELNSVQQLEGESIEAFNLRKLEINNAYLDAKQTLTDKEVEIEQIKYQAAADITSSLSALADAAGEHSRELAMASKVLALAEIAINTGKAIAAGIAQAQSVPFPGNIAAIATTIATVLSNITSAISTVKSAKFATGGAVVGSGSGTSDSIPAQLSNGESVMTAMATSMFAPLLSSFNMMGGGVPINITTNSNQAIGEEMLAQAIAKGFMMAPPPVLSVEEFTSVANRTRYVENLGDI